MPFDALSNRPSRFILIRSSLSPSIILKPRENTEKLRDALPNRSFRPHGEKTREA